jgi:large subunit ribosomal protein L35
MSAAETEAIFMAELNLSPSDASSGAAPDPGEEKMRRRVLRANSPCTTAAEEEMREASAREVCEETRGVWGVLARNDIAAVPKASKDRQERNMPKNKTHSGAKKRFRVTGSGKLMKEQANKRHLLEHKSSRRTRRLSVDQVLSPADSKKANKLLGR